MVMTDELRTTDVHGRLLSSQLTIEGITYGTAIYGYQDNGQVASLGYLWADGTSRYHP